MPCKRKGTGRKKKTEENKEKKSSTHGQAIRSITRNRRSVEKSSACPMMESTKALWREYSR